MERDHRKEEIGSGMHHYVEVGTTYLRVKSLEPEKQWKDKNNQTTTQKQKERNKIDDEDFFGDSSLAKPFSCGLRRVKF